MTFLFPTGIKGLSFQTCLHVLDTFHTNGLSIFNKVLKQKYELWEEDSVSKKLLSLFKKIPPVPSLWTNFFIKWTFVNVLSRLDCLRYIQQISFWDSMNKLIFSMTLLGTGQFPPGQLPPGICHLEHLPPGQFSLGQFPPRIIASWTTVPPENWPPDNSHLGILTTGTFNIFFILSRAKWKEVVAEWMTLLNKNHFSFY